MLLIDRPTAVLDVADQLRPLLTQVSESLAEQAFRYDTRRLLEHQHVRWLAVALTICMVAVVGGDHIGNRHDIAGASRSRAERFERMV
ncbi:hypothetical protein AQ860_01900 [Burkholderia pseudomallei]|nr:hypothetical protein AQ760_30610 [Burkholderia pseudomallei]OMZ19619.1 hypothetical protein AQ859_07405 [Burkholderia pseudomallei]OMZ32780.1 hypothetical protein AQ860_01900 [Burkholderia pseudomallei]